MLRLRRGRRLPRRRPLLAGYRRPVAAVLLAAAAGLAVDAVAADPPPGVPVTVAARDLPAGHRLAAADLATVTVPVEAVPDGAVGAADAAGSLLASPVRRGEPVTDARLGSAALLAAAPAGTLAVPVRVGEPAALDLVEPGTRVSVLAGPDLDALSGGGEVLVSSAVVLRVLAPGGGGLLGAGGETGPVLVLALDRAAALRVAAATGSRVLTVAVLP